MSVGAHSNPGGSRPRHLGLGGGLAACALLAAVALGASAHTGAQPRRRAPEPTEPAGSYRVGSSPYAVRLGDFDGDGLLDLVTANIRGESLSVLLSEAPGRPGARIDTPTGGVPIAVAAGDFTGDGRDDVAAAVQTPAPHLALFEGRGRGRFEPWLEVPLPGTPSDVVLADLDLDGRLEAIVSMNADELAVVRPDLQHAEHTVRIERIAVPDCGRLLGQAADGVAVGDMDRDGLPDVAVACLRDWSLQVRLGADADTGRTRRVARVAPERARALLLEHEGRTDVELVGSVRKLRLADLDGDGYDDAVGVVEYGELLIAFGGASGPAGSRMLAFGVSGSNSVVPADIDEDGRPELLVTSGHDPELLVLRSDDYRGGELEIAGRIVTPRTPESLDVADLDGDGHLDVVVVGEHASAVRYLRGDGAGGFVPFSSVDAGPRTSPGTRATTTPPTSSAPSTGPAGE